MIIDIKYLPKFIKYFFNFKYYKNKDFNKFTMI